MLVNLVWMCLKCLDGFFSHNALIDFLRHKTKRLKALKRRAVKELNMTVEDIKNLLRNSYNKSCFLSVAELYQFTGEKEYKHIGTIKAELIGEIMNAPDIRIV